MVDRTEEIGKIVSGVEELSDKSLDSAINLACEGSELFKNLHANTVEKVFDVEPFDGLADISCDIYQAEKLDRSK